MLLNQIAQAKLVKNSMIVIDNLGNIAAVVENNRFGVPVFDLPGGSQDVEARKGDLCLTFETGKSKKWLDVLKNHNLPLPKGRKVEEETIKILEGEGFALSMMSPYDAALQELGEEVAKELPQLVTPSEKSLVYQCITKRSLLKVTPSLKGKTLDGVEEVLRSLLVSGVKTTTFHVFMGRVETFDGIVFNYTDKLDHKTPSREGYPFYERGCAVKIETFRKMLADALIEAQRQEKEGSFYANKALLASYSQYMMVRAMLE